MARRMRFTKQALDELATTKGREWVYDDTVPHLALMVTSKGAKSFYVVKYNAGKKEEIRIGSWPQVAIPVARREASETLLRMIKGEAVGSVRRHQEHEAKVTLQTAFDAYYKYLQQHRKPTSITQYQRVWERVLKPWAGNRAIRDIRRRDVLDLHRQVGEHNGHYLANRVVAFLRAILNRTIRDRELVMANPANAITFYREVKRSRRLMAEELPAFFKAVEEEPNTDVRDFVLLALFTGARKSNLLAMRWADISLDRGLWIVPAEDSKNSKELDVVLSAPVVEILRARREAVKGEYVFPARPGRNAVHMMDPKIGWDRICKRAGIEGLHMHDLRRSLASFQIDAGTPLEVIQKTLGHESKTTTEIYARMALETVRASVERAAEDILRAKKG
jgi:integrase